MNPALFVFGATPLLIITGILVIVNQELPNPSLATSICFGKKAVIAGIIMIVIGVLILGLVLIHLLIT